MTPNKNYSKYDPHEEEDYRDFVPDSGSIKTDLLICFLVAIAGVIVVAKTLEILTR